LLGQYGVLGGAAAISTLILISLSMLINYMVPTGIAGEVAASIGQILIIFIEGILLLGFSAMVTKTICNMPTYTSELFSGFKNQSWIPVVQCELKLFLYSFFCFLPAGIGLGLAYIIKNEIISACAIGMAVGGVILFIYVSLLYNFRFYCMLDFPGRQGRDYMRLSKEIIKGHVLKLLAIKLSFIPWAILVILSFGIASIWVKPYKRATEINYYLYLMSKR